MSTTSIAITGMKMASDTIAQTSNNIANSETPGFKSKFTNLSNIAGDNGVYGIESKSIDVKGSFEYTGIVTDLSVKNGKGFFIVKNKLNNEVVNVTTGTFRPNSQGELEYLNKYVLLGVKYNDDGSVPDTNPDSMESIIIDNSELSPAIATTNVTEGFNLNSSLLAKGQASFIMTPQGNNRSETKALGDPIIADADGGAMVADAGFAVQIQEEKNGQVSSQTIRCLFNPAIASNAVTDTGTTIAAYTADDAINILYNGQSISIKVNDIARAGTNDGAAIQNLVNSLKQVGLNVQLDAPAVGKSRLVILPPNNSDTLSISGSLAASLAITANITPLQSGYIRFSSMRDLKDSLDQYFSSIESDTKSDTIVFIARPNTNTSLVNLDTTKNVLGSLGMYSGPVLGQGYDPYDQNSNMASGNTQPDISQGITLFDSKGNPRLATVALKKVEDGWIQEFFAANPDQVAKGKPDGLLQVTKFTFDTKGKILSAGSVFPTVTTKQVTNPFAAMKAGTFTVNGKTFTQGTDFTSMADLANAINSDQTLKNDVTATIAKGKDGAGYSLRIISKGITTPTATSTSIEFTSTAQVLPDASTPLSIDFNDNVDPLEVKFDFTNITESSYSGMSGLVSANGAAPSNLTSISIDANGILMGNFANGTIKDLYKIPLATYANINGLDVIGDNALRSSAQSGRMQIFDAGKGGSGEMVSGNIELSNVDQAEQLTRLITNKQFYNMNTKSWQTGNVLIDYLLNATN